MLIGYRCKVCGAPVDPETGYCKYCDTLNTKPIINKPVKHERPRIIVRKDGKEAEIKPLELSLHMDDCVDFATRDIDGRMNPYVVQQYAHFEARAVITQDSLRILSSHVFDTVFTGLKPGYAHEFKAYMSNIQMPSLSLNTVLITEFEIMSVNPVDMWNTRKLHNPILEGAKCPICGADLDPRKPKCDYCGYWWLYSPEGR